MTGHTLRQIKTDLATGFQESDELVHMFRQRVLVQASQANIEEASLAEAPAIALEIVAKIQFRNFFLNGARGRLLSVHLEFDFLCHNRLIRLSASKKPGNRAEMAASANQQPRFDLFIDDPATVSSFHALDGRTFADVGAGAPQQVFVKLTAPDAVADWLSVGHVHFSFSHGADAKAGNGLKDAAILVVGGIDLQSLENKGSDPAATDFVA